MHPFIHGRNLNVIEHDPASNSDLREQVSELDLRKGIGMGSIQQHQIQGFCKTVRGKCLLRFTLDEGHRALMEIRVPSKAGNGPVGPVDRENGVIAAEMR